MTRTWIRKVTAWMLALICYKPAAAAVYAAAFTMIGSGGSPRTALMGFVMLALSVVMLPALMKFFTWTTGAIAGAGWRRAVPRRRHGRRDRGRRHALIRPAAPHRRRRTRPPTSAHCSGRRPRAAAPARQVAIRPGQAQPGRAATAQEAALRQPARPGASGMNFNAGTGHASAGADPSGAASASANRSRRRPRAQLDSPVRPEAPTGAAAAAAGAQAAARGARLASGAMEPGDAAMTPATMPARTYGGWRRSRSIGLLGLGPAATFTMLGCFVPC